MERRCLWPQTVSRSPYLVYPKVNVSLVSLDFIEHFIWISFTNVPYRIGFKVRRKLVKLRVNIEKLILSAPVYP